MNNNDNCPKFDDKGNLKTDLSDGITITALMMIIIAGIIYFLYTV